MGPVPPLSIPIILGMVTSGRLTSGAVVTASTAEAQPTETGIRNSPDRRPSRSGGDLSRQVHRNHGGRPDAPGLPEALPCARRRAFTTESDTGGCVLTCSAGLEQWILI